MLVDKGVNVVVANELGFGASELLKQQDIKMVPVEPGTKVADATKLAIKED